MTATKRPDLPTGGFTARRLIGVDDLNDDEIRFLIRLADYYTTFLRAGASPPQRLAGKTQINLFFENSTRTNMSFELAGKKLGADVIVVPVAASSVHKGECAIDTARTLAAMGADIMVIRASEPALHERLQSLLDSTIVSGGHGAREHPTQALLDAATICSAFHSMSGLTVAICGDVRHSRVAGSGARLFTRLGARVRFVGPAHLMPPEDQFADIERHHTLAGGLHQADVIMTLRMQFERMDDEEAQRAASGYFDDFGLTHETIKHARAGAKILHPGPINRGVEIDGALADDPDRSLILHQVFYGVSMRMAVLDALLTETGR